MHPTDNPTYKALLADGIAAQGDLLIVSLSLAAANGMKIDEPNFEIVAPPQGGHIVAHSETGHHHVLVPVTGYPAPALFRNKKLPDPEMQAIVRIGEGGLGKVEHRRDFFTHGEIVLPSGNWVLARQGRPTPEGWKKVQD